jgi:hypothetical protein
MVGANQCQVDVEWASELQTEPAFLLATVGSGVFVRTLSSDTVS